ncbi:MAG: protein kinase [Clostridia bacterium]|nr:protein kinase [Clostridia bacterium]
MATLKIGDTVKMKSGGSAKVLAEFGSGGQGTVYKVNYNGKEYALKWYHSNAFYGKEDEFYTNLENNIMKGAPTEAFLWPLGITEKQNGSFGYIMDIYPDGYEELTNFFVGSKKKPQVRFKSFAALITAAINIIQAFRELHNRGYSYQDINNGNFFIDPANGRVLICDNDNVSPYGTNLGIRGKQRWMAPEIVTLQCDPDKQSDRFSLAVVLFRLLFINHPLEGRYSTPPCMTKALEKKYYGTEPIFVFDPTDTRNRPIPGTDHNLKLFWGIYPEYIREIFCRAFSQDVMLKRKPRVLEKEWLDAFFRLRAETGTCPVCQKEMFYAAEKENCCFECGKRIPQTARLVFKNDSLSLSLFTHMKVYLWNVDTSMQDIETVVGEVVENTKNPNLLGMRNVSAYTWMITLPDNTQRQLEPGSVVPLKNGFVIDFMNNKRAIATIEA